jgi:hypothetical protein
MSAATRAITASAGGGTPGAPTRATDGELAADARVVEQLQGAVHRGHRRGVPEVVGHQQPPVPIVARVGLRVAGDEVERGVDVARLVVDAQVQLEVRPVAGKRVDDLLEGVGKGHRWAA